MLTINLLDKWEEKYFICDICGADKSVKYHVWDKRTNNEKLFCKKCVAHVYKENMGRASGDIDKEG